MLTFETDGRVFSLRLTFFSHHRALFVGFNALPRGEEGSGRISMSTAARFGLTFYDRSGRVASWKRC